MSRACGACRQYSGKTKTEQELRQTTAYAVPCLHGYASFRFSGEGHVFCNRARDVIVIPAGEELCRRALLAASEANHPPV
jgi:hypothetical protein